MVTLKLSKLGQTKSLVCKICYYFITSHISYSIHEMLFTITFSLTYQTITH